MNEPPIPTRLTYSGLVRRNEKRAELRKHQDFLHRELEILKSKLQPSGRGGRGNIHTAISVMEWRIDEIDHELSEK